MDACLASYHLFLSGILYRFKSFSSSNEQPIPASSHSYSARLQRLVRGNLATALLGGVPGTRQLVQSYLAVRPPTAATDNTLVDGLTVWPVIYHCLRCGDAAAARDAAAQAGWVYHSAGK